MAFLAIMGAVEKNKRHCLLFYKVSEQYAKKEIISSARFCNSRNDCKGSLRCSSTDRYYPFNLVHFLVLIIELKCLSKLFQWI